MPPRRPHSSQPPRDLLFLLPKRWQAPHYLKSLGKHHRIARFIRCTSLLRDQTVPQHLSCELSGLAFLLENARPSLESILLAETVIILCGAVTGATTVSDAALHARLSLQIGGLQAHGQIDAILSGPVHELSEGYLSFAAIVDRAPDLVHHVALHNHAAAGSGIGPAAPCPASSPRPRGRRRRSTVSA